VTRAVGCCVVAAYQAAYRVLSRAIAFVHALNEGNGAAHATERDARTLLFCGLCRCRCRYFCRSRSHYCCCCCRHTCERSLSCSRSLSVSLNSPQVTRAVGCCVVAAYQAAWVALAVAFSRLHSHMLHCSHIWLDYTKQQKFTLINLH